MFSEEELVLFLLNCGSPPLASSLQMSVFHHAIGLVRILDRGFPAEKVDILDAEEDEVSFCLCVCVCVRACMRVCV